MPWHPIRFGEPSLNMLNVPVKHSCNHGAWLRRKFGSDSRKTRLSLTLYHLRIHYTHEEHDKFFEVCKAFNFIIVRCNPGRLFVLLYFKTEAEILWHFGSVRSTAEIRVCGGQIKADGGDQQKFDDGMRAMRKAGIQAHVQR